MDFVRGDIVEISGIDLDKKMDRIRLQKMDQIHPLFMPRLATQKTVEHKASYLSSITLISKSRVPFTSPTTVRNLCLVRRAVA